MNLDEPMNKESQLKAGVVPDAGCWRSVAMLGWSHSVAESQCSEGCAVETRLRSDEVGRGQQRW